MHHRARAMAAACLIGLLTATAVAAADPKKSEPKAGATAEHQKEPASAAPPNQCVAAGPQAPRDISKREGRNLVQFSPTPELARMQLCNVHFHRGAEHRSAAYGLRVEDGAHSGWACQAPKRTGPRGDHDEYQGCGGITPGDTVEVHWVYTTCDLTPKGVKPMGPGLQGCMTETCANPQLRVEAQVFTLAEDAKLKFNGSAPVSNEEGTVRYIGSTTGPSWSNRHCSPLQVSWNVRPSCSALDIRDFAKWCSTNRYKENHAHGVRELVTQPALLSPIQ